MPEHSAKRFGPSLGYYYYYYYYGPSVVYSTAQARLLLLLVLIVPLAFAAASECTDYPSRPWHSHNYCLCGQRRVSRLAQTEERGEFHHSLVTTTTTTTVTRTASSNNSNTSRGSITRQQRSYSGYDARSGVPRGGARLASFHDRRKQPKRRLSSSQQRTIPSNNNNNNKKNKLAVLSAQSFRRRNDGVRPYNPKVVAVSLVSLFFVYLLYDKRSAWLPFFNKDKIQQTTLRLLENLQPNDNDDDTHFYNNPLLLYTTGMMLWEAVGLSTIPVETAAGMAFGWKAARYSLAGKLLGAFLAFAVGRFVLAGSSSRLLANNPTFQQLVRAEKNDTKRRTTKSHHPPLLTAFLIKFSVFPETIKNVGSAVLTPIRPWMFLGATVVHGGMYTLLWTWLGVDTARQLQASSSAETTTTTTTTTSRGLQITLVLAAIVGVVLTPLLMAWWVRDLKRMANENKTPRRLVPRSSSSKRR